ncbi:hypothetical protein T03_3065 [Trichinella britovi]|uniref:Uncharacterized protein n=1 Tax=Trichinella britovi TaxID=45882 RepID=A0A0V1CSX9_TRIBR|nr:hypothetical protein T03_3065 [Trichinella britovi]
MEKKLLFKSGIFTFRDWDLNQFVITLNFAFDKDKILPQFVTRTEISKKQEISSIGFDFEI